MLFRSPDMVIADRLSGQGPFVATDPFMTGESFNDPEPITPEPVEPQSAEPEPAEPEPTAPETAGEPEESAPVVQPDIPLRPRVVETDIPLRPRQPEASAPASKKETPDAPPSGRSLDAVFKEVRAEVSRQTGANEAAEYLGVDKTYLEMEMTEEAINALRIAARAPAQRFEAGALVGRRDL